MDLDDEAAEGADSPVEGLAPVIEIIEDDQTFLFMDANFIVNLLTVVCNLVTAINMLFEAQIFISMCLEFIDEEDDQLKTTSDRTPLQKAVLPPLASSKVQEIKQETEIVVKERSSEDSFFDLELLSVVRFTPDLFELEKLLYPCFFLNYRSLKRKKMRLQWVMQVTAPFYVSVGLLYWFLKVTSEESMISQGHALAVDLMFTLVVPMTILVFS